jgi:hypothetical protein
MNVLVKYYDIICFRESLRFFVDIYMLMYENKIYIETHTQKVWLLSEILYSLVLIIVINDYFQELE